MNKKDISIIIPTKDSEAYLEKLLVSIKSNKNINYEIIIVDSNSTDKTITISKKYDCTIVNSDSERSESRNIGAIKSSSDLLLFLDSDMEINESFLRNCLNEMKNYDALIFMEITTGGNMVSRIRRFERIGFFKTLYLEAPRCIKKNVFLKIGGYDLNLSGAEDLDLNSKLINSNFKICWSNSIIMHHEDSMTIKKYIKKRIYYNSFMNDFYKKDETYFKKIVSVKIRLIALKNSLIYYGILYSIVMIPMVIFLRLLEITASKLKW